MGGFKMLPLLLLLIPTTCLALNRNLLGRYVGHQTRRDFIFDQMMGIDHKQLDGQLLAEKQCPDDVKKELIIDWYNQTLDHFGGDGGKRWGQHYQEQNKFFDKEAKNPVIFLMIGGEGPINNKWVCLENYTYMQAAAKHKAKVIQLEHRFFGANTGLKDLSTESLKLLTTEQALADINEFIGWYNKKMKWDAPKWVAFGGSYPGTIAALLRVVYPNVTQGNIASSAPLNPVVDFWQYAQVMEYTIQQTSQQCYDAVHEAFKVMASKVLSAKGRADLNRQLHLVPGLDVESPLKEDVDTVTSNVFSAFQGLIQYTFDGAADRFENKTCPRQNIYCACQLMTDSTTKDPLDRLYKVVELAEGTGVESSALYKDSIADLLNVSLVGPAADMRGWLWLSCNEFGWLQSTSNNALFGDPVPISLYIRTCSDLFDAKLNATQIDAQIQRTLDRYGRPHDYNGTNVFLPNGAFDPWSSLGVLPGDRASKDDADKHTIAHLTPESAHCSDMYAKYDNEPKGLAETRQLFNKELDYYIGLESVFVGSAMGVGPMGLIFALMVLVHLLMN